MVKLKLRGPPPVCAAPPVCAYERVKPYWEMPSSSWMYPLFHSPPCCHPPGSAAHPSQSWELKEADTHTPSTLKESTVFYFPSLRWVPSRVGAISGLLIWFVNDWFMVKSAASAGHTAACAWCEQQRTQVSCVLPAEDETHTSAAYLAVLHSCVRTSHERM